MQKIIIHSDLNNFFASVEALKKPWLKDVPMAVAGDSEQRHGVILAKNIHAARYGVKTAEPLWSAFQKCPQLITVPPSHDEYIIISDKVRKIYCSYSDKVESFGIDECWLDISHIAKDFNEGKLIADEIREKIRSEIGITASCGVSFTKTFAKLGSDLKKPDATTVIPDDKFKDIIWKLPAESMLFVGKSTKKQLEKMNICSIGDIASTPLQTLEFVLGKNGTALWQAANGTDSSTVQNVDFKSTIKSVGNSTTTPHDLVQEDEVRIVLWSLAESVSSRLRRLGLVCDTVQIYVRDNELNSFERQKKLPFPNRTVNSIFNTALELYLENHDTEKPTRSIGIRAVGICDDTTQQLSLHPSTPEIQKKECVDVITDTLRKQYGKAKLVRGIMLVENELTKTDIDDDSLNFTK